MAQENHDNGLLGKLKQKLNRMLGRKEGPSLDITFKSNSEGLSARKAFRIDVDNMHVICRTPKLKCRISDISASGIGFVTSKKFPVGEIIDAVLLWSGKPVLKKLKIKIVRQDGKMVGCEFQNLERSQDQLVNKIVLAAQKRLIQKKQSGKNPEKTEEEIAREVSKQAARGVRKGPAKKIKI